MKRINEYFEGIHRTVYEIRRRPLTRGKAHESEIFICGVCHGTGKLYRTKGGDPEVCEHCEGKGRIKVQLTIERVPLD